MKKSTRLSTKEFRAKSLHRVVIIMWYSCFATKKEAMAAKFVK
jgi:hypothetical protein